MDERGISLSLPLPARERRRFSGRTVSALADPRVWEEEKTEEGRHGKKGGKEEKGTCEGRGIKREGKEEKLLKDDGRTMKEKR